MVNILLMGAFEASSGIRFLQAGSTAWSPAKEDWREILTEIMFDCAWSSKIPSWRRLGVWKQVSVKPVINIEHFCSLHSAPRPYYCHCLPMLLAVLHGVCNTQVRLILIQIDTSIPAAPLLKWPNGPAHIEAEKDNINMSKNGIHLLDKVWV